jgi:hypothetical protein
VRTRTLPDQPSSSTTTTSDFGSTTLGWGPNGHPLVVANSANAAAPYMTLHWDGDIILFITDASGTVVDFKAGLDGEIAPRDPNQSALVTYERDVAGLIVGSSLNGTTSLAPLDAWDGTGPNFGRLNYAQYVRPDGFEIAGSDGPLIPGIRINGVRAFDSALGSWTTPDAFEGDIRDPASQQKYMWNRGNPVDYSDPSGYESQRGWYDTPTGLPILRNSAYDAEVIRQYTSLVFDMLTDMVAVADGVAEMRGGLPSMSMVRLSGKAPEIGSGILTESGFLRQSQKFLGNGYSEVSQGRYVSADGLRQVRFGAHETRAGKQVHAHFEAYDKPQQVGGKVVETSTAIIVPDKK